MATYRNSLSQVRQWMASEIGDLVLGVVMTDGDNSTTCAVLSSTSPPQFFSKENDFFNLNWYESYCYAGTNIGTSQLVTDWATTDKLTLSPAAAADFDNTSRLELHNVCYSNEYLNAINMVIEGLARRYLFGLVDETSTTLVEGTTNDDETIYTWEYNIPTNFMYIHRITIEDYTGGKKLTGTVSDTFTLGEQVVGDSSSATGIVSYSGATYILVRDVDGTFAVGETATGQTSGETCSTITAVATETVGKGTFTYPLDHRDWSILRTGTSPHTLKLDKDQVKIYGDLRLRWEGQASQAKVSADTDYIYINPEWFVKAAIAHLPHDKLINAGKEAILAGAINASRTPIISAIDPAAKAVIE